MKKLFVMLLVFAVVGGPAFAAPKGLKGKVARKTVAAQAEIKTQQEQILSRMAYFRTWVGENSLSNSHMLQGIVGIMDDYLELANKNENAALALNEELNKTVVTKSGYRFTLREFVKDHGCEILSDQDNFDRFENLLDKKYVKQYSAAAKVVLERYKDLLDWVAFTETQPYHEQSFDNTVTPYVRELMEAHNALKAKNPAEALELAKEIVKGKFDIPGFIDRFSYGWGDEAEQDAYAAYLRSSVR